MSKNKKNIAILLCVIFLTILIVLKNYSLIPRLWFFAQHPQQLLALHHTWQVQDIEYVNLPNDGCPDWNQQVQEKKYQQAKINLNAFSQTARGTGGVNSLFGGFSLEDDTIKMNLASTRIGNAHNCFDSYFPTFLRRPLTIEYANKHEILILNNTEPRPYGITKVTFQRAE